jgi:hypothetical protein
MGVGEVSRPRARIEGALHGAAWAGERNGVEAICAIPETEDFFIFSGCNPLKSPDSKK